jgi:serine/threonine-protein kinase
VGLEFGVTIGAWLAVRWGKLTARQLLLFGLGYQVFMAMAIAVGSVEVTWVNRPLLVWSPVAVWILIFPIIVPNGLRQTALASGICALSEPLIAAIFAVVGVIAMPPVPAFVQNTWPNILAALIAIAISRLVFRLGEKLAKARSMGSYELTDKLGAGGMGEVWKGKHRLLARSAAVKLIRPSALGRADEAAVERAFTRFEHEAQATAALKSPHTIEVYDFGLSRDGTFYYVMELLEGMDLATLVEEHGPQPPERVAHLLAQACHSLYEAHNQQLIHRDIKPANLFMCRYGEDLDFVKVLDFGLVKQRVVEGEAAAGVTQEGMISGTPSFMPPEMALGSPKVDGRADIYALGCVGYALLTGKEVFDEQSTMAVLTAHIRETPPPLSERSPLDVPPDMEAVIMSCLEKKPEDRPQTARNLAHRLRAVQFEQPWTQERAAEWWSSIAPKPVVQNEESTEMI